MRSCRDGERNRGSFSHGWALPDHSGDVFSLQAEEVLYFRCSGRVRRGLSSSACSNFIKIKKISTYIFTDVCCSLLNHPSALLPERHFLL